MTLLQKFLVKQSALKVELGDLLALEQRSDEQESRRDAIGLELRSIERDIRDARLAEPEPKTTTTPRQGGDAETRERLELRSQFSVGRFIGWKAGKNPLDGQTAEYMQAVESDGKLPIDVFEREQRSEGGDLETRAVTPGVQGGATQRPIVPAVFKRSVAPFLGISMPSVGVGDAVLPVLSTAPASGVGAVAKDAAVDSTAGAFMVSSQQPRRIGAQFTVRVEDLARLDGMESSLRQAIEGVVAEELDDEILNGAGAAYNTDGEIRGLLAQLTDPSAPGANAETWARFNAAAVSHLADPWAVSESDVRLLVGEGTYKHAAGVFRANNTDESFTVYANRVFGGIRMSGKIAAPASNIQQAVVARANPANDAPAVMPAWSGFDLTVRDVYTGAAKGQVMVTVNMLIGDVVLLRSDVFVQHSFRLA